MKWERKHTAIAGGTFLTGMFILIARNRKNSKINKLLRNGFTDFYGKPNFLDDYPRGIRNNNPGNIRKTSTNWQGKVPANLSLDSSFEMFTSQIYGIRALLITLRTYITKHKRESIRAIINAYAPPSENHTDAYINRVAKKLKVSPDTRLQATNKTLKALAMAIIEQENGLNKNGKIYLNNADMDAAIKLI